MSEPVDHATYNANVQRVQREATLWGMQHRVRANYTKPDTLRSRDHTPRLYGATFEVFWDRWRTIGAELDPMTPECRREWSEDVWAAICHQAAAELAKG
jgi:hypothetical protein